MGQFQTRKLVEMIKAVLTHTKLAPEMLDVEISESMAMTNANLDLTCLKNLSAIGTQLIIDDFGTGYSSLSRLKTLPVNTLKIDQSFIKY